MDNDSNTGTNDEALTGHARSIDFSLQQIAARLKSIILVAWLLLAMMILQGLTGLGMAVFGIYQMRDMTQQRTEEDRANRERLERLREATEQGHEEGHAEGEEGEQRSEP